MTSARTKRVSNIERIGRVFAAKDAEIQRLRAAMAHAMDDAEWASKIATCGTKERETFQNIARCLKIALEKK